MAHIWFNAVLGLILLASLTGVLPAQAVPAAGPQPGVTTGPYAPDHLIVKLREEARVEVGTISTQVASLDRTLAGIQAVALVAVPGLPDTYRVELDGKGADIPGAVAALNHDPAVEYAEPDYLAEFTGVPDDPRFGEQWGLLKIRAGAAWDQTMGSPAVVIAVIDSGIDLTHEDLAPNLWVNPGEIPANKLDDDSNGFVDDVQGWNFVNATNNVQDVTGHGSLVAGISAARTNNAAGIAGVCGSCRILPVKVVQDPGPANYSDIAAGVAYAASKGARVINVSLGGYADSATLRSAINAALTADIVVVAGAGNDNSSSPFYPAAYAGVIAVAATDENDRRVGSSNYGTWVDVSAPGAAILSTTLGGYTTGTGTSFAAPFVSGTAGLLLSLHPDWTNAMVHAQFLHTTDDIDGLTPGYWGMLGSGRLNAAAATQPAHPNLTYQGQTGNGIPGFRPDPGSTVSLMVTLSNDWAEAADVTGTLSSPDPLITITTAEAVFGTIASGASQANAEPFVFDVAAAASYNHPLPFTLALSANGGSETTVINFTLTTSAIEVPVSGLIDVDTLWTSDKLYKVTGGLRVAPGCTLSIQKGTVVKFAGIYRLVIDGTLIAQGTPADPIRFEPYTPDQVWAGIALNDSSRDAVTTAEGVYQSGTILQHVTMTGASAGIECTKATPYLDHVTIDRGLISCSLGGTDLWLQDSTVDGTVSIRTDSGRTGHLARVTVDGNASLPAGQVMDSTFMGFLTIYGDGQVGNTTSGTLTILGTGDVQQANVTGNLVLTSGQVLDTTVRNGSLSSGANSTISDCTVNKGGISAGAGSRVTHNTIARAPANGITTGPNSTITFNRIVGAVTGVVAGSGLVEHNLIANTTGNGLQPGTASVRHNTFIGNSGNGVSLVSVPAAFEGNNFEFNPGLYDVYAAVPQTTLAGLALPNNWWGTTDEDQISARIWDYEDDASLTKLIPTPVLTDPSQNAPAYVRSVMSDPAGPVGIQTVNFTVAFSRPMDTQADPRVVFQSVQDNAWKTFNTGNSSLPDNNVVSIAVDPDGSKWFGLLSGGVAHLAGTTWTIYNQNDYGVYGKVNGIAFDPDGSKWFATISGVLHFDGKTWIVYDPGNSPLPDACVNAIAVDLDGSKWFGTDGGVAHFDGTTWTVYDTGNSALPRDRVTAIAVDPDGSKWFGTLGGGVAHFDGTTWTVYDTSNSALPGNFLRAITLDADGSHWFGTDVRGVAHFDGITWTVYNTSNSSLPDNRVMAITIDPDGSKWFGTWGGGAAHFDGTTWTVYDPGNSGLPELGVNAIAIDAEGYKWMGTPAGVGVLWSCPRYAIRDNPGWLDETHFQVSYDFTALIARGDYRLTVADAAAADGSGMLIAPDSRGIFNVDYPGGISDPTPPEAPVVLAWGDGSLTQLSARASAGDPDSGIAGYRYAIGSMPGGSDVIHWTHTPDAELTHTGLLLQPDQAYYVSFQARNLGGLWSPVGVSNPVINGRVPSPTPTLTQLSPATAVSGSPAFTLTVMGTYFIDGSVVRWNGVDRTTTYVDATRLTAGITAADIAIPGDYSVTVFTPAPGGGASNALNFTVTDPPNTPPGAANDDYATPENAALNVAAPGVLENDSDADGNPLTAILVAGPAHGLLTLNENGSFTYTPDANWSGIDAFTYQSHDGLAVSDTATVTIVVVTGPDWTRIYLPLICR